MLDAATFQQIRSTNPAIAGLSEKVAEILRDELEPGETVEASYAVTISGTPGALVLSSRRAIAVWTTKLLIFFKFPTIQQFHYEQVNELRVDGASAYMHASATPGDREEDYEEGTFAFASAEQASDFAARIGARAPRLG